tara:strand:- start:196 stop:594 length:399 start_codon:yes stop_codon:yes gene_type:complete
MAVTHTWSIDYNLKTKTQDKHDDIVYSVIWKLVSEKSVKDSEGISRVYSTASSNEIILNTSNINLESFISFSDLTEDKVLKWAKSKINSNAEEDIGVTCSELEAGHERNIEKQINPPTKNLAAPWTPTEVIS